MENATLEKTQCLTLKTLYIRASYVIPKIPDTNIPERCRTMLADTARTDAKDSKKKHTKMSNRTEKH